MPEGEVLALEGRARCHHEGCGEPFFLESLWIHLVIMGLLGTCPRRNNGVCQLLAKAHSDYASDF